MLIMNYFISVEDLVANALIELVEKTGNRTVSFSQLNKYGDAIIAKLRARNIDATLIYTRDKTEQFSVIVLIFLQLMKVSQILK